MFFTPPVTPEGFVEEVLLVENPLRNYKKLRGFIILLVPQI